MEDVTPLDKEEDDDQPKTPLPVLPLFILCCIVLSESFSITMIFPFLADMVLDFGLTDDEGEIGFYAGWIASCFNIAQFTSSFMWGKISDRIGRRPVLLIGLGGNLLMVFLFGWSKELWYAILARSLNGFLNGNIGVVKTYLTEITDDTNAAKGFSVFGLCWGVGLVIGPSIGGFLSKPGEKAPHIFPKGSLLSEFPYLLPCLASCLVTLIGFILGIIFLKESVQIKLDSESEKKPLVVKGKSNFNEMEIEDDNAHQKKEFICLKFFRTREVVATSALYAFLGFYKMMVDEVFALWAPLSYDNGGIDFSSNDIGLIYAVSGCTSIFTQLFLFPVVIERVGPLYVYRFASFAAFLLLCTMPTANLLVPIGRWAVWTHLSLTFILFALINNFVFVSVMMLVNNSAMPAELGSVNGFAQTWTSLFRSAAPSIAGYILAWSLTNNLGFPLNFYFTFFVIGFFALLCFGLTFLLDKSIDYRK